MLFDYYTSDYHFGHKNIIQFCDRPYSSIYEMDRDLVERYRASVSATDRVAFLGDILFHSSALSAKILEELPGQKFLVKGNHDKKTISFYLNNGFLLVSDEIRLTMRGKPVVLSHFPPNIPGECNEKSVYIKRFPKLEKDQICIHGHTHSPYRTGTQSIHVGVDAWGFNPAPAPKIEHLLDLL